MKGDLVVGAGVFEAFVPGTRSKYPQGMSAGFEIVKNEWFIGVVMGLVGLVVENDVEVGAEIQGFILK